MKTTSIGLNLTFWVIWGLSGVSLAFQPSSATAAPGTQLALDGQMSPTPTPACSPMPAPSFHLDGCIVWNETPVAAPPTFIDSVTITCAAHSYIGYEGGYPHEADFQLFHVNTGETVAEVLDIAGDCTYSYPPYSTCYFSFDYTWIPGPGALAGDYLAVFEVGPDFGVDWCSSVTSSTVCTYRPCLNHGDLNFNGVVTPGDALTAYLIYLGVVSPDPWESCAADCNNDGNVTVADAQAIFWAYLEIDSCSDPYPTFTPTPSPSPTLTPTPTLTPSPTPFPFNLSLIPAGGFNMGAPVGENCSNAEERPVHTVTLTRAFYMQRTEVTQGQWISVFGSNPAQHQGINYPVEMITWFDAVIYCNRLSQAEDFRPCYYADSAFVDVFDGEPPVTSGPVYWDRTALGYRLPTEAEWEYACRAGTTAAYFSGQPNVSCMWNDPNLDPLAWYWSNSGRQSREVGLKQSNAWNLYDMPGNVFEWCWDAWASDYYTYSPAVDPAGPAESHLRVTRGGTFDGAATYGRSAKRFYLVNSVRYDDCGLRVVRAMEEECLRSQAQAL